MADASKKQSELILNMGPLTIAPADQSSSMALMVPLNIVGDTPQHGMEDIHLFVGGTVWEDSKYSLYLELTTTKRIKSATFCVNYHNEFVLRKHDREIRKGTKRIYHYLLETDDAETSFDYVRPFSLTCGFARVEVTLRFSGGRRITLGTEDIVSLDEPRRGGPSGETAEEANLRDMFASLIAPENNQASEWMFSPARTAPDGDPLSPRTRLLTGRMAPLPICRHCRNADTKLSAHHDLRFRVECRHFLTTRCLPRALRHPSFRRDARRESRELGAHEPRCHLADTWSGSLSHNGARQAA